MFATLRFSKNQNIGAEKITTEIKLEKFCKEL